MLYILRTNTPASKEDANTWIWFNPPTWNCLVRGTSYNGKLWWCFGTNEEALNAKEKMINDNYNIAEGLQLQILETEEIPRGWE